MDEIQKVVTTPQEDEIYMQENKNMQIAMRALKVALKEVFGEGVSMDRFLDKAQIPLICKNVQGLSDNYKEMKASTEAGFKDIKETTEKNFLRMETIIGKKEDDYEQRLRILEAAKNNMDGKADKNSVWFAYLFSAIGLIVGIVLHFWK